MGEWLIDAAELHTLYGSSHALHGVSFRVAHVEAVGLMGRNCMGKTTLLRTILGLVRPRAGTGGLRRYSPRDEPSFSSPKAGCAGRAGPRR